MPPSVKITKEQILDACIHIIRTGGERELNARSIANYLGCSTQPIYSSFKSMENLIDNVYLKADEFQTKYINEYWNKIRPSNYKAFGMGFIKFAKEEKELFRFMYMGGAKRIDDTNYARTITEIQKNYGISKQTAEEFHGHMTVYSYGLAVLNNLGRLNMTEEEISDCLTAEFGALRELLFKSEDK